MIYKITVESDKKCQAVFEIEEDIRARAEIKALDKAREKCSDRYWYKIAKVEVLP